MYIAEKFVAADGTWRVRIECKGQPVLGLDSASTLRLDGMREVAAAMNLAYAQGRRDQMDDLMHRPIVQPCPDIVHQQYDMSGEWYGAERRSSERRGSKSTPDEEPNLRKNLAMFATPVAGWVSVEERLPEHEQVVAVIFGAYGDCGRGRIVTQATYFHGNFINDEGDQTWPPSHWCALPPAPVTPKQEQS